MSAGLPQFLNDREADRDLLDFTPYTETLVDIVRDENNHGPLVIGLFGTWGSGKTSLMHFVEHALQHPSSENVQQFRIVWFDAWKYEKEESLWRALLLRVVDALRDRNEEGEDTTSFNRRQRIENLEQRLYRDVEWEEKAGITIDWAKLGRFGLGGAIKLSFAFVPGLSHLVETVKSAQGALGKAEGINDLFDTFRRNVVTHHQAQLNSIEQFQNEFGKLVQQYVISQNQRLVVFIDDLDRCLPEKAIEVLEAIKLFLDVKGCIFLLGLDQDVIARGIKVKYRGFASASANDESAIPIDGVQYLEKIIQLPFRLPKIEPQEMKPFIKNLLEFSDVRCADVFAEGLETNPRKVKRAINIFLFVSRLAERRKLRISQVRLAKVIVIYHNHPILYDRLRKNPALLRDVEKYFEEQLPKSSKDQTHNLEAPTNQTITPPVGEHLLADDALRRVMTLYLRDYDACFQTADYTELDSYFTLTRGTVIDPLVQSAKNVTTMSTALGFPIPIFVRIPEGEFRMGTSDEDISRLAQMPGTQTWARESQEKEYFKEEKPDRCVYLNEFEIAKYPVTYEQYQAFIKATRHPAPRDWSGDLFRDGFESHPVANVSWIDAIAYCRWLTEQLRNINNLQNNEIVRLPIEAEWEKAASWDALGQKKRIWPWGDTWQSENCNTREKGIGTTTPVGKFSPKGDSPYGIADMAGNVWEWCADWYQSDYYENASNRNPYNASAGQYRVARGSSWYGDQADARCAFRFSYALNVSGFDLGFRCVKGQPV